MQNWTWRYKLGEFWAHSPSSPWKPRDLWVGGGTQEETSVPEGHNFNDFINREEFTLHYSTMWYSSAGSTRKPCQDSHVHDVESLPGLLCNQLSTNFASALHWVLELNHAVTLLHYLDGFVLLDPPGLCTCQDSHVLHVQSLPGAGHASCHRKV